MRVKYPIIPILFFAMIAVHGCSRGGGETATPPTPQPTATLNGIVAKGPIGGAAVNVYAINFGTADMSAPIGSGQTSDGGNYSIDLAAYTGPVLVEVTGGSFTDEVSGLPVALNAPIHTIVPNVPSGSITTAAVTPFTELAFRRAKGSGALTEDSITSANASIASTFGLKDIVSTLPAANGETDDQKKYATACGAFSQLINDNRGPSETLDDSLARLIGKLGDEEEHGGKLSTDSTVMINGAISNFSGSVNNTTGTTLDTLPLPTSGLLVLSTAGTPNIMAGVDVTVNLPAGVILNADPITGETASGVVSVSGEALVGSNNLAVAKYTPASIGTPARLHIVLVNVSGFRLGEFATVQFDLATGAGFPLSSAFTVMSFSAKGLDGSGLSGMSAVPSAEAGI
jgi:hypothetical protein